MAGAEFFKRNEDQAIDWLSILAGLAVTAFLFSGAALAQDPVPMTVEADDLLEWNQTEGIYTATGNAVAVQGTRTIRGDVLIARYDPDAETKDIDEVTATGDVSFEDETTEATGSKLVYNIANQDYSVDGPNGLPRRCHVHALCRR